jgi:phage gp29-like protein
MADNLPVLYEPYNGLPIKRELLTKEIAGPTITGVRTPYTGYPGDGLNPRRLAAILREADFGDPIAFFELAEQIEERDLHYTGVLATRKRSVAQLEIHVDPAEDTPDAKAHAAFIQDGLAREELQSELFDMLDAIGKGMSLIEIIWDTSEGDWALGQLKWRDPRWFRPDRRDGVTPMLRADPAEIGLSGDTPDGNGFGYVGLPAFKFINTVIRAKSGLPIRSGLARLATWSWMFKAYTLRDWAIFAQTFGQPVRVGKYPIGSSEADKDTLFSAVANIAGDCAAIIPESMTIEFVEAANIGAGHALYKERADWFDQQVSKAVLGQTATTDAIAGGHAVGKEHRAVQEDIERSDAKALSAVLNRDLVCPWIQLQFGPQKKYPRIRIGRAEDRDVQLTISGVNTLVPMGMKVASKYMNSLLGIPVPEPGEDVLVAPPPGSGSSGLPFGMPPSLNAAQLTDVHDPISALADYAEKLCGPGSDALINQVRGIVERATSLQQIQTELKKLKPGLAEKNMAGLMRMARAIANMTGRASVTET